MRKVSFGKRLLSMLLALVLVFGILPTAIWATNDVLDAAIFGSDVHGKDSDLKSVLGGVNLSVNASAIGLVGDTCLTVSKTESTVAGALGYAPSVVFSYAAGHDTENSADIKNNWDESKLAFSNDNYYIYTIRESDMESSSAASSAAAAFTAWANSADTSKPVFIISHKPLHSRRNDNAGAATWYTAISAAAEKMDIVFFWAHNHTNESSVDTNAYYVEKDGTETISVQGGSTVVPNFTYMNAGYINANGQNPSRKGVVTTVELYADKMVFQDYNSSGAYSGTYAHNVTVEFEFANLAKVTPSTLSVTGVIEYAVGDTVKNPTEVVVTYSDGTEKKLSTGEISLNDLQCVITDEAGNVQESTTFASAGTYKLTYSYTEGGKTASAVLTVTVKVGMTSVEDYAYVNEDDADSYGYYVEATGMGLTGMNATYVWEEYLSVFGDTFLDFLAFDIALEGHTAGDDVTYVLELDEFISLQNLCLYYVDENNALTPIAYKLIEQNGGLTYLEFTANHDGVFLYGNVTVPEDYELSHITVDYQGAVKYLVGDDFDMVNILVNAVYTKEGAEDFVTQIYAMGYGVEDGYEFTAPDMTTSGVKTVTLTYGGKSVSFQISVYEKNLTHAATGVSVELTVPGASKVEATDVTTSNGSLIAAVGHLLENYKAYDIELVGYNDGEKVIVTLPVPAGVENPVVLYVSDDGKTVQNMGATKNDDGTVSFETDHFSVYTVGDSTEITVPDPTTATVTGSTTESKEVYVKVDKISAAGDYLLVDVASATTSANLLTASSSSVTNTSGVTVVSGKNAAGTSILYIEDPAAATIWTASGSSNSYKLYNSSTSRYLQRSSSTLTVTSSSSATSWNTSKSNAVYYDGSTDRYIRYNSGWSSLNSGSGTVYIYQKQTVEFVTSVDGTYSIAGTPAEVTKVVASDVTTTATLGSTLTFTPVSGDAATTDTSTTATYTVVENGDPSGIIKGISGNTVTFTGKYGKALVKVSYTGEAGGKSYTVDNYIVVTASAPYYELTIQKDGKDVTGTTISIKGVTAGQKVNLSALIKEITSDGSSTVDGTVVWNIPEEYHSIANVDTNGVVTLTGEEGGFYVTVSYTKNGVSYTAGVNFTVTLTQHVVPEDGTDDFPEYPNEGAIRFDKTATAVGNFSETGIAKVELSMTGVPYTTDSEIDVVLMLDMTGSMDDKSDSSSKPTGYTRIDATIAASKAFIRSIVINKDGTYNGNRIGIYVFNKNGASTMYDLAVIDTDAKLQALVGKVGSSGEEFASDYTKGKLDTVWTDYGVSGGTPYDDGLGKCQEVLAAAKEDGIGNNRKQFTVFMTDGVPTDFEYITGTTHANYSSASSVAGMLTSGSNYATRDTDYKYEYYSTEMKKAGVTVYSVGVGLFNENNAWSGTATQCGNLASALLNDISGPANESEQPDKVGTATLSKKDKYFFSIDDADAGTEMKKVFSNIAAEILQAATDVKVEDKITDEYTMIFDIPTGSKDIPSSVANDFYIEFLKYTLDADHERTGDKTSVTKLYLKNTNGKLSAAKDGSGTAYDSPVFANTTLGEMGTIYYWTTDSSYAGQAAVTYTVGSTSYYFIPNGIKATDDGYDATKWFNMTSGAYATGEVDSETNMSTDVVIATPYFVYNAATRMLYWTVEKLDTAEYALSYFLYLDFSATEVGTDKEVDPGAYPTNEYANLTYTNFQGEDCLQEMPIPQQTWSGAQVSYVFYLVNAAGQPINKSGQVVDFANATFVTDLYTENTVWNKGEDGKITADSKLSVDWLAANLLPSDYEIYDEDALYQLHVFGDHTGASVFDYFVIGGGTQAEILASLKTRLNRQDLTTASVTTTKVYNTKAGEKITGYGTYASKDASDVDKVVKGFDFYDTTVAFAVVWQPALAVDTVVVDFGLDVLINVTQNDLITDNTISGIGLGKDAYGNIAMNNGVSTSSKLGKTDLTVGGNTIHIENDTQIRFHQGDMVFDAPVVFYYESSVSYYESSAPKNGYLYSQVTVIPATSIYYEDNFLTLASFSMNTASGVFEQDQNSKWTAGSKPTATQDLDRPGENKIVGVLDADNNYGYDSAYKNMSKYSMGSAAKITVNQNTRGEAYFTFTGTGFDVIGLTSNKTGTILVQIKDDKGNFVRNTVVDTYYGMTHDGTPVESDSEDALYQVPVIKMFGLTYGTYHVTIMAVYNNVFDHTEAEGEYDLYLDAVRVYDPTGNQNETANNAYIADGEGWPLYTELRNNVIKGTHYTVTENDDGTVTVTVAEGEDNIGGLVFIDCNDGTSSLADYISHGPNNELYLDNGQAIAFNMAVSAEKVLDLNGDGKLDAPIVADVQLALKSADGEAVTCKINGTEYTISTATDMYYSILKEAVSGTVVIQNVSGGILSITNIKVTHNVAPEAESASDLLSIDAEGVAFALMSLRRVPVMEEPDVDNGTTDDDTVTDGDTTEGDDTVEDDTTTGDDTTTDDDTTTGDDATEGGSADDSEENGSDVADDVNPETGSWLSAFIGMVCRVFRAIFGWIFN